MTKDNFFFEVESRVTCSACGTVRCKSESYNHLQVTLDTRHKDLQPYLENFEGFQELLDGDNKYECESCQGKRDAIRE